MPGRPYDFWLLDLDGTLVDVDTSYARETMSRVGDRLDAGFGPAEAETLWFGSAARRSDLLSARGVDQKRFWTVFDEEEDPAARAEATSLYDDAADFVPSLSTPVGLVTHNQHISPILDTLGIADWFDTVVRCGDGVGWKPDPRPLEVAMTDLDVDRPGPSGAMVGDAPADLGAARNAGLDAVHVDRGGAPPRGGPTGDRQVRTFAELESY
jgi:phosphoglycolate phosphatase